MLLIIHCINFFGLIESQYNNWTGHKIKKQDPFKFLLLWSFNNTYVTTVDIRFIFYYKS